MKKFFMIMLGGIVLISSAVLAVAAEMDTGLMAQGPIGEEAIQEEVNAGEMGVDEEMQEENPDKIKQGTMKKSDSSEWGVPNSAKAVLKGTEPESLISGTVDFIETGDGVQVVASLANVTPPGNHGFHVHENGSCEDGGKAAGGHFNPGGTDHGLLPKDGHDKAHSGDMGNIVIDKKGNGSLIIFMPGLSLSQGSKNIAGKAVILHEQEDDFGQPVGNAGGRIGCGLIELNK